MRPSSESADPDPADPADTDPADPAEPDTADPAEPDTADPAEPDTADPAEPDRADPDRADPDVTVVLQAYDAFARGDIDQAVAALHPDVEWVEPEEFPYGGPRRGPDAVAAYLRASRAMWAELTSEPTAHRRGDKIVIVHRVHGRLVDGSAQDVTVADVYTLEDGRVVQMTAYADPAEALAIGS
jgi:ketosteroid isomerase-like protein